MNAKEANELVPQDGQTEIEFLAPVIPIEADTVSEEPSGTPPLTPEQVSMVISHANIAYWRARHFENRRGWLERKDVQQMAMLGLIRAVQNFDPDRGAFSTFAFAVINGTIKHGFREDRMIKHRRATDSTRRVDQAREELYTELQREPTDEEVADRAMIAPSLVRAVGALRFLGSLDVQVYDGETIGSLLTDPQQLSPEAQVIDQEILRLIRRFMDDGSLPPKQVHVLQRRFFYSGDTPPTQAEVAAELGCSQMHVSRLETKAIERLRQLLDV